MLWPLAIAGVIAYLLDPVVDWFERKGVSRAKAIVSVFVIALLIVAAIALPALGGALSALRSHGEGDRLADRHREMLSALSQEREKLRRTNSVRAMRKQAIRVEEAMLSENTAWLRQIRFIVLELPGG